jgi:hypothetical protein
MINKTKCKKIHNLLSKNKNGMIKSTIVISLITYFALSQFSAIFNKIKTREVIIMAGLVTACY